MNKMTQQQIDDWNRNHPPGTDVMLMGNDGKWSQTKTRSIAWLLGHGEPVVKVEGKTGGWGLDRVWVKKEAKSA